MQCSFSSLFLWQTTRLQGCKNSSGLSSHLNTATVGVPSFPHCRCGPPSEDLLQAFALSVCLRKLVVTGGVGSEQKVPWLTGQAEGFLRYARSQFTFFKFPPGSAMLIILACISNTISLN